MPSTPLLLPGLDSNGWSEWAALTGNANPQFNCHVAYVDEDNGFDATQAVIYDYASLGTDPIHNPPSTIKPFKYAVDAFAKLFDLYGLQQQCAVLYKRGGVFRGKPIGTNPLPGANLRREETGDPAFNFTGPDSTWASAEGAFWKFPILIGAYGPESLPRPILHIYAGPAIFLRKDVGTNNILIRSLHFRAPRRLLIIQEPDGTGTITMYFRERRCA